MNKIKKSLFLLLCVIASAWLAPILVESNPSLLTLFFLTVVVLVLEKFLTISFKYMPTKENPNKVLLNSLAKGNPITRLFCAYGIFVLYFTVLLQVENNVWFIRGTALAFLLILLGLNKLVKEVQCKIFQNIS